MPTVEVLEVLITEIPEPAVVDDGGTGGGGQKHKIRCIKLSYSNTLKCVPGVLLL